MYQDCQQVIEDLGINMELFFYNLDALPNRRQLSEFDKRIVCQSLLGYSRQHMANVANLSDQQIRDRLANNIYPRIAELMQVE